jgi:hypothetical protein
MRKTTFLFILFCLSPAHRDAYAQDFHDVALRYHEQWKVEKQELAKVEAKYGVRRINFDSRGSPQPKGLTTNQEQRWQRLYSNCMLDGCFFCDAPMGSCETGTCGPRNASCKPFLDKSGHPHCGKVCADYAFSFL